MVFHSHQNSISSLGGAFWGRLVWKVVYLTEDFGSNVLFTSSLVCFMVNSSSCAPFSGELKLLTSPGGTPGWHLSPSPLAIKKAKTFFRHSIELSRNGNLWRAPPMKHCFLLSRTTPLRRASLAARISHSRHISAPDGKRHSESDEENRFPESSRSTLLCDLLREQQKARTNK